MFIFKLKKIFLTCSYGEKGSWAKQGSTSREWVLLFKQKVNTNDIENSLCSSNIIELEAQNYESVAFSK